eukprot:1586443-Rhodomonas_salina.2
MYWKVVDLSFGVVRSVWDLTLCVPDIRVMLLHMLSPDAVSDVARRVLCACFSASRSDTCAAAPRRAGGRSTRRRGRGREEKREPASGDRRGDDRAWSADGKDKWERVLA